MLVTAGDHLVPGAEVEAREHDVHAVGGRSGEHHLGGLAAHRRPRPACGGRLRRRASARRTPNPPRPSSICASTASPAAARGRAAGPGRWTRRSGRRSHRGPGTPSAGRQRRWLELRSGRSIGFAAVAADLQPMAVGRGSLAAHAPVAGADAVERVHAAARPLRGARVLHVTAAGGGRRVAESLGALLPLAADAGLRVEWRVLFGEGRAGQALRDGLQGAETAISDGDFTDYEEQCDQAGHALPAHDVLVLHDPGAGPFDGDRQAGGAALSRRRRAGRTRRLGARPAAGRGLRRAGGGRRGLRAPGARSRGDPPGIDPRACATPTPRPGSSAVSAARWAWISTARWPARSCRWTAGRTRTRRWRPLRSRARSCPISSSC